MLSEGSTSPAQTTWAAPIVFPGKKNGSHVIFLNFGKLYALTKQDGLSISVDEEFIELLHMSVVFSTLHTYSRYWQVEIHNEGRVKKDGLYFTPRTI